MQLVVSEKPSVGSSIAKVLGAHTRKDGYIEGSGYIISWCIGHLVAPAPPEEYDDRYRRWDILDLPIVPDVWQYQVLKGTAKQFNLLKRLMNRRDVTEIICATDAGREGEHIFRLVYNEAGCKKPFKRLWISSLEEQSIRDGFNSLHDGHEFDNLYYAALARSKADWLIGINATRLYSLKNDQALNIGRVQTPVLNMLVRREQDIHDFIPKLYYTVELDLGDFTATTDKIAEKTDAESIMLSCQNRTAVVTDIVTETKSTAPPKLYDLTTLQREANKSYGYTAQFTLDTAQKLYEKKLITYPRTDSRYITSDVHDTIPGLLNIISDKLSLPIDFIPDTERITDNSKVSDHHALLPTKALESTDLSKLTANERDVLFLILRQLLCSAAEPYKYDTVKVTLECEGIAFHASGKTVIDVGWGKYLSGKADDTNETMTSPLLNKGTVFENAISRIKEYQTSPPKHYTEDTLLSAMENAVKTDNSERQGLGTPATRAGIIENLVTRGFVERKGKSLIPSDKGNKLISLVPDTLKSADMTAQWEAELSDIANGRKQEREFVQEIQEYINDLVNKER